MNNRLKTALHAGFVKSQMQERPIEERKAMIIENLFDALWRASSDDGLVRSIDYAEQNHNDCLEALNAVVNEWPCHGADLFEQRVIENFSNRLCMEEDLSRQDLRKDIGITVHAFDRRFTKIRKEILDRAIQRLRYDHYPNSDNESRLDI